MNSCIIKSRMKNKDKSQRKSNKIKLDKLNKFSELK